MLEKEYTYLPSCNYRIRMRHGYRGKLGQIRCYEYSRVQRGEGGC